MKPYDLKAALQSLEAEAVADESMGLPTASMMTPLEVAEMDAHYKEQEVKAIAEEQLLLSRFPQLHAKYKALADAHGLWLEVLMSLQPYLTNNPQAKEAQVEHKLQQACYDWDL